MELLTPAIGPILLQCLVIAHIVLIITSWIIILITNVPGLKNKISWLIGTLFLPIIGPLIFLFTFRALRRKATGTL